MEEIHTDVEASTSLPEEGETRIGIVGPESFPGLWSIVGPLLQRSIDYTNGEESLADVLWELERDVSQLWVVATPDGTVYGVVVTSLVRRSQMLVCHISHLAGYALSKWIHHLATIENWATHQNARRMTCYGRPGLKKTLQHQGFRVEHFVFGKALERKLH